jgi:uncharacterized protein
LRCDRLCPPSPAILERQRIFAAASPPYWQYPPSPLYNESDACGGIHLELIALAESTAMPVPMELSRIIISEVNDQQVIYLKEIEGDRTFPILIGIFEATSIDRRVKGYPSPRPLTHDLIVNVVESLGGEFQDVVISELKDHTYYAKLRVRHDGELVEIDARPSDAIAVAVTCTPVLPIYVNEDVLNDVLGEQ